MTLNEYQKTIDILVQQSGQLYLPPFEQFGELIESTGRVARIFNSVYGMEPYKPGEKKIILGQELTDIIFTVICIANREGINFQEEWDKMMSEKHYGRDKNRFEKSRLMNMFKSSL